MNVPPSIAQVLSTNPGLLADLNTRLNLEALHDLLEVQRVDEYNMGLVRRHHERQRQIRGD